MATQIIIKKFVKSNKKGYWYLVECKFCKANFEIQGFKLNEGKGNFCSKKCYGKSRATNVICGICLKEYYTNENNKGKKYCSQKCMAVAYKNEGNPCWRGGKSRLPYHHTFREKLKREIRERDNYTCAMCGNDKLNSFDAHVHHINGDKLNCNKDNLIVLCRWCHGSISGRGIFPSFNI